MRRKGSFTSEYLLILSFLGLILVSGIIVFSETQSDQEPFRKPVVSLTFSVICLLGIVAGISPSKCSCASNSQEPQRSRIRLHSTVEGAEAAFAGHHPDCGGFDHHILKAGNKELCAGCSGLVIGAIFSLFGVILYFIANLAPWPSSTFWILIGALLVSCGLLQYLLFNWSGNLTHMLLNILFVFGVFMLLVGADVSVRSIVVDMYVIALGVFWVYSRIMLSRAEHNRICSECKVEKCRLDYEGAVNPRELERRIP